MFPLHLNKTMKKVAAIELLKVVSLLLVQVEFIVYTDVNRQKKIITWSHYYILQTGKT